MDTVHLDIPYELRIGVTGHRELGNSVLIRQTIDNLIDRLAGLFGQCEQTPLEWVVISPLAKGADRLVAKSVLRYPASQLEVITPFPLEEYRKDFSDIEDLSEFDELFDKKRFLVELETDDSVSDNPHLRNTAYLRAGKAVVDSCEILIAVGDGKPAKGMGGTGDIVSYALERGHIVLWIDTEEPAAEPKMLSHSESDGLGNTDSQFQYEIKPIPDNAKDLSLGYHQLAAYCSDTAIKQDEFESKLKHTQKSLSSLAYKAGLPVEKLKPIFEHIMPHYVRADALTLRYQKLHVMASKAIFLLSATAVSIAVFQVLFYPHHVWIIGFEIIAMIGALLAFSINKKQAWHEKWLHDRFLAEQLRTSMYTLILGKDPCANLTHAPGMLPFYAGPKSWLLSTGSRLTKKALHEVEALEELDQACKFITTGWLEDQQDWHYKNAVRKETSSHRTTRTVLTAFWLTLAMACLHFFGVGHHDEGPLILSLGNWITFIAIISPAWGASAHAIGKLLEYERIAMRSEQMARELKRISSLAEDVQTQSELNSIVNQATRIINLENYEWWVLLSFNPPELAA
ncbi:MAG: hypothetical protein KZQ77_15000 [Candidatus Thiodiazotropha sp. (ex Notomyrtea botanica)]|nr:hypothetical protein [Candidatus Thiodiazotropha sp. (ex Notomyrtea botanica)]